MPRISTSTNYLFQPIYHERIPSLIENIHHEDISPNDIDRILSRKLYEQLWHGTSREEPTSIDSELTILIEQFFNLTYQNTIPMVNLLATAIATNFLQENIRQLDKKLREQQRKYLPGNIKRGCSLLSGFDNDQDDDDISWASAPT